jgi:4-hydroxy-tetrahydrodipicolinate reductase
MSVRLGLIGTGRVGRDVTRLAAARHGVEIVAACSRDAAHHGRDLGELAGGDPLGVTVAATPADVLAARPSVVLIATTSFLGDVAADLEAVVRAGANALCTAEEAACPWAVDEPLADRLGGIAREHGVTILGAGANPGFVFDALVLTAAGAGPDVRRIAVERHVNFSRFSANVLGRLGVGYSPEAFAAGVAEHRIFGHIGFPESMRVVAHAVGRRIESIDRRIEPIFAERPASAEHLDVPAGHTAGVRQHYVAMVDGEEWFVATLVGHIDPHAAGIPLRDTIEITGTVKIGLTLDPGLDPQMTSASVLVNSLERLVAAPAGWVTVAELPPAIPA